jgi:hypothetical protein
VAYTCLTYFFLIGIVGGGIQGPLGTAAANRPIVLAPGDYDDRESGGIIGKGNRSTRRKPAPVPLCPPQSSHAAWTRTRAAAVGSQRLTAFATARPAVYFLPVARLLVFSVCRISVLLNAACKTLFHGQKLIKN